MQTKLVIVISAIVLVTYYVFANSFVDFKSDPKEGIQFHKGTWNDALQLAKKENKLIFLDIYATWCGPCKKLKANTFSNKQVGSFYNQNFINVALDGEQEEGNMLMHIYSLRSFPSILFIDSNGNVVEQTAGYHNANDFLELGKKVLK